MLLLVYFHQMHDTCDLPCFEKFNTYCMCVCINTFSLNAQTLGRFQFFHKSVGFLVSSFILCGFFTYYPFFDESLQISFSICGTFFFQSVIGLGIQRNSCATGGRPQGSACRNALYGELQDLQLKVSGT